MGSIPVGGTWLKTKYGGRSLTVRTLGCGPGNTGSIPVAHPNK